MGGRGAAAAAAVKGGGGGAPSLKKRKYGRADSAYFSRYGVVSAFTCQNLTLRPWYAMCSFTNVDLIASLGPHHDANTSTMWSMSASKSASPWTLAHSASVVIGVIDTLRSALGGMVAVAGAWAQREAQREPRRPAARGGDCAAERKTQLPREIVQTMAEVVLFAKRHVRTRLRHSP